MLAFSRLPSSSSQCSAELSSGKQNCWSGMICCDFSSSSGLPLHRCPSAQVHSRPSQDLDLVQLFPSACRHKTHGDHNSWIYFQFHELALQQLYLISSAPGAGCPARITLLFNHIGRAAVPVALQCSWNWVILGQAVGFLAAITHGVSAGRAQTMVWLTTLSLSGSPFVSASLPSLSAPFSSWSSGHTVTLKMKSTAGHFRWPQQPDWAQMDGLCSSTF